MQLSHQRPSQSLLDLVQKHLKTPYFVMDLSVLADRIKSVLSECDEVGATYSYPVKANCTQEILDLMKLHHVHLDVCSVEELDIALNCGYDPSKITVCGAGFDAEELKLVIDSGAVVELDSLDEVAAIAAIAPGSEIGLRIAVPPDNQKAEVWPYTRKFGLTVGDIPDLKDIIADARLKITSFHMHSIFPVDQFIGQLNGILREFTKLTSRLRRVNFGGGWGDGLAEDWLTNAKPHMIKCTTIGKDLGAERVFFEAGEAVVGPAGWLITRIRALKKRRAFNEEELVAICDTPYTFAVGSGLIQSIYPVIPFEVQTLSNETLIHCALFGRNNSPYDLVRANVALHNPVVGMLLGIGGQGAYVSSAMGKFNSRTVPETIYSGG